MCLDKAVLHLHLKHVKTAGLSRVDLLVSWFHFTWPKLTYRWLTFNFSLHYSLFDVTDVSLLRLLDSFLNSLWRPHWTVFRACCHCLAKVIFNNSLQIIHTSRHTSRNTIKLLLLLLFEHHLGKHVLIKTSEFASNLTAFAVSILLAAINSWCVEFFIDFMICITVFTGILTLWSWIFSLIFQVFFGAAQISLGFIQTCPAFSSYLIVYFIFFMLWPAHRWKWSASIRVYFWPHEWTLILFLSYIHPVILGALSLLRTDNIHKTFR